MRHIPEGGFKSAEEQVQYYMEREKKYKLILPILGYVKTGCEWAMPSTYDNGFEGLYALTDENEDGTVSGLISLNGTYGTGDSMRVNYQFINLSPSVIKVMAREEVKNELKDILEEVIKEEVSSLKEYIDSSARDLIGKLEDGAGSNGVTEKTLIEIVKTISKNA